MRGSSGQRRGAAPELAISGLCVVVSIRRGVKATVFCSDDTQWSSERQVSVGADIAHAIVGLTGASQVNCGLHLRPDHLYRSRCGCHIGLGHPSRLLDGHTALWPAAMPPRNGTPCAGHVGLVIPGTYDLIG